jgi:hypothetical protein
MKKLIIASSLFILSLNAFAFMPQLSFFVNNQVATTRVWNTANQPLICSGYAFGQTYNGIVLNSWFNSLYIMPGMYADAYVYSNYYDPFARAWAQVDCQYTW